MCKSKDMDSLGMKEKGGWRIGVWDEKETLKCLTVRLAAIWIISD